MDHVERPSLESSTSALASDEMTLGDLRQDREVPHAHGCYRVQ